MKWMLILKNTLETINLDKKKLGNDLNVIILKEIGNSEIYKTTAEFFKRIKEEIVWQI